MSINQDLNNLSNQIALAINKLDVETKSTRLKELISAQEDPNFWQDPIRSKEVAQEIGKLKNLIEPWTHIDKSTHDLLELANMNDESLGPEITSQYQKLVDQYQNLQTDLKFSGKYDNYDAVLTIQAGAGGTDAQDWALMLKKMYLKWAESSKFKTEIITESIGDEAGIKSATFEIDGKFAYGKLKGEHGVHRLVRLSPFNSAGSRETSFAFVEVLPKINQPDEVELDGSEIKIDVFRSGGKGGQSVNTTDSAVRVTHLPTGIVISIQNERSQTQNRENALAILRSKLAKLAQEQHTEKISQLRGPNVEAAWGNQIRNYVLHPYNLVKDTRTNYQETDAQSVLNGKIDGFIEANLMTDLN